MQYLLVLRMSLFNKSPISWVINPDNGKINQRSPFHTHSTANNVDQDNDDDVDDSNNRDKQGLCFNIKQTFYVYYL